MGILNVTPDSFYDGGRYRDEKAAIRQGIKLVKNGADIVDIGGESSRPGARRTAIKEELKRVIPVIEELKNRLKVPISIDTYKSRVAEEALKAGAEMINDISALRMDKKMVRVAEKYNIPVVLMHMQGSPRIMQRHPHYRDVIAEIYQFLNNRIRFAENNGISQDKIIIDPGIGFGKTTEHNLLIIKHLKKFTSLRKPILIGPSRKSFIGNILNLPVEKRLEGTVAAAAACLLNGAEILRVHDVKQIKMAADIVSAIKEV